MSKTKKYLMTFFDEKDLSYQCWSLLDSNGTEHVIDTDFVKESIFSASSKEQETIADTIRKIDFKNGDVNLYLKFLAECIVKQY
jgi:hypothetical protein